MIVFDVTDEYVQPAERLVGKEFANNPSSYAFLIDFREYFEVMRKSVRQEWTQNSTKDSLLSGIACLSSVTPHKVIDGDVVVPFFYAIDNSECAIVWICNEFNDLDLYEDVVNAVYESARRMFANEMS